MKALLQYLVLVGIPVLGVLGILELGKGLTAPRAMSGVWQITPAVSAAPACPAAAAFTEASTLTIEQSGPRLVFEVSNLTVHGLIKGQALSAESERISLTAQLEATRTMRGTLSFPACTDVPSIAFSAVPEDAS